MYRAVGAMDHCEGSRGFNSSPQESYSVMKEDKYMKY